MMQYTASQVGTLVRNTRRALGVSQRDLALTSGTGQRFISELEGGKATCQLGKVLLVLHTLGIQCHFRPPVDIETFSGNGAVTATSADNGDGSGWG